MAGNRSATKIPMIAMTTSNSTSVNPATCLNPRLDFRDPRSMFYPLLCWRECFPFQGKRYVATLCDSTGKVGAAHEEIVKRMLIHLHTRKLTQIGFHAIQPRLELRFGQFQIRQLLGRRIREQVELDLRLRPA